MTHLTSGRIKLAEYARQYWVAVAPANTTLDDVLKPEFWTHVAGSIKAWDRIEVRSEDDSWYAELIVCRAERLATYCEVITAIDLTGEEDEEPSQPKIGNVPDGYEVNFGGPVHKWRVLRSSDSECLAHGMRKVDAVRWAQEHAAQVRGKAA